MAATTRDRLQSLFSSFLFVVLAGLSTNSLAFDTEFKQSESQETNWVLPAGESRDFGTPPDVPRGPLSDDVRAALQNTFGDLGNSGWGEAQVKGLETITASGDPRLAWLVADLARFVNDPGLASQLVASASALLNLPLSLGDHWGVMTDHLIAWDIPAPPDYFTYKKKIFALILPGMDDLLNDGAIDWRHVSWGGVPIDDRPFDQTDTPCNCIPAADNPETSNARDANWLKDGDIVFGITINGEARAYPRRIMEVREMVNDTLGGRDLGIPYCTLCGSAQAYFTDDLSGDMKRPVLRTSGLLIRSNKVMYDLTSLSIFDTFTGKAVTGPLAKQDYLLQQASVVTTTWGAWKRQYPETTVLVESLALGRDFDFRNNRDASGPIFPIGPADTRLALQEDVLGVITAAGEAVAFHVPSAKQALQQGMSVQYGDIRVVSDGDGLKAVDETGKDLGSHQAFWFAWSQFHPGTALWPEDQR